MDETVVLFTGKRKGSIASMRGTRRATTSPRRLPTIVPRMLNRTVKEATHVAEGVSDVPADVSASNGARHSDAEGFEYGLGNVRQRKSKHLVPEPIDTHHGNIGNELS